MNTANIKEKYNINYIKAVMSMLNRDAIRPNSTDRFKQDNNIVNEIDTYLEYIDLYKEYEINKIEMYMLSGIEFNKSALDYFNSYTVKRTALDLLLLSCIENEVMFNFLLKKKLDFSNCIETFTQALNKGYHSYINALINRNIDLNYIVAEDSSVADICLANIMTSLYIHDKPNYICLIELLEASNKIDTDKLKVTKALLELAKTSWVDEAQIKSVDVFDQVKEIYKLIYKL